MQQPAAEAQPSPVEDAAADPSQSRGTEGTQGSSVPDPAPEESKGGAPEEPKGGSAGFILDSGAHMHGTGSADLLSNTRPPEEGSGARFPTRAGEDHAIAAVGTIVTPDFTLHDVRLVRALGPARTVVSVRQLMEQGLAVTFGSDWCSIKEQSTGNLIGKGRLREDGFYYLDYLKIPQS